MKFRWPARARFGELKLLTQFVQLCLTAELLASQFAMLVH